MWVGRGGRTEHRAAAVSTTQAQAPPAGQALQELPRHGLMRVPLEVAEYQRGAVLLREPAKLLVEGRVQLLALEGVVVVHLGRLQV